MSEASSSLPDFLNLISSVVQPSWSIALLGWKQAILQPAVLGAGLFLGVVTVLCGLHLWARRAAQMRRHVFLSEGGNLRYASVEIVSFLVQPDFLSAEQRLMGLGADESHDELPATPADNCRRYILDLQVRPMDGYFPRWKPASLRLLNYDAVQQLPKLDEAPPWGTDHHLCLIECIGKYSAHRGLPAVGGMKVRLCFDARRGIRTLWLSYFSENLGPVVLDMATLPSLIRSELNGGN